MINKWFHKKDKARLEEIAAKPSMETKKDEPKKEKAKPSVPVAARKVEKKKLVNERFDNVIVRSLVTEKAAVGESEQKYSFVVGQRATKTQVIRAMAVLYGVKPVKVNMINIQGRTVRFGRTMGRRSDYKKAIVTLGKGQSINLHSGV